MQGSTEKTIGHYKYDEAKFLGEGSFGKVYKGTNTQTGETVAIKRMDMSAFKDQFMIESLKNEIGVMKQLHGPNVVRLFDVYSDYKQTYIVLEFCPDGDLRKYLSQHNYQLDEKDALPIFRQLMLGFKDLVNHGYIHRDIKPENSLVKANIFKVADFGFATKVDITGRNLIQECVGTPLYMAPQLLQNHPYTAKSDIWSIGILFYEMLFGKTPWPCRDQYSYLRNMTSTPLRFPYDKPIGQNTKDFIEKCLKVSEAQRIGWDEAFTHPLIHAGHVGDVVEPAMDFDDKSKKILRTIQELVQAHNLDLHKVFNNFDKNHGGSLDETAFWKFLITIDPRITSYDARHLFKIIDEKNENHISFEEFQHIFCGYDYSDINDHAAQVIIDLKEIIKANNLSVRKIFDNFDVDHGGSLDRQEFDKLIRVIAPAIKGHEIDCIFKKFDENGDGSISFEEFYRQLVSNIQGQDSKINHSAARAQRVLVELKRIIKENSIDIHKVFNNFDKDHTGTLDPDELTKLLRIIDPTIPQEECYSIFHVMDQKKNNNLDFSEFAQFLK